MNAYVLGAGSTPFRRWPDRDFRDLSEAACRAALSDAGLDDAHAIEEVYFGNCAMDVWGQSNIRGQVALGGLRESEWLLPGTPIVNVEGGCATATSLRRTAAFQARMLRWQWGLNRPGFQMTQRRVWLYLRVESINCILMSGAASLPFKVKHTARHSSHIPTASFFSTFMLFRQSIICRASAPRRNRSRTSRQRIALMPC